MPRVFLVEAGAVLAAASISASDSLAAGATEATKPLTAAIPASDALAPALTDVLGSGSALFLVSRRTDTIGIGAVDGHFDPVPIAASDTIAIGQPLVEDEFNRNETPLSTNWGTAAGLTTGLKANTVFARGGDPSLAIVTGSVWTPSLPPQQVSEIVLVSAGGLAGPVARGSTATIQGYWLRTGGDTPLAWTVQKLISAGPTFSQIAAGTWVTPVTDNSVIQIMVTDGLGTTAPSYAHPPELPRQFLSTPYVAPTGTVINVGSGGDLQAALNAAQLGDMIVLAAGVTFTGNFVLPNKVGTGWIYVVSSLVSEFPEGVRVVPGQSGSMPKIVSSGTAPAVATATGAHHFRFVAVEIATTFATTDFTNFNLILLEAPGFNAVLSDCPHDLVFDRCYIHGTPTGNCRRGIMMNGASLAAVECYVSDFHEIGADSQAICVTNGPGPFKIVNNYLEAAGENVLFGGADPEIPNLVPSEIEFRNNYCFKPLTWRVGDPTYAGLHWSVKNLFELKNAQRVLVDGNTFDRVWGDAQIGFGIVLTVRNQDGTAPWSTVQDITVTNNLLTHAGGGMNIGATDNNFPSQTQARLLIRNNVFDINGAAWGGTGRWIQIADGGVDYIVDHNTAFHDGHPLLFTYSQGQLPFNAAVRLIVTDNICNYGPFGFFGDFGVGSDNAAFNFYAPDITFRRNAIVAGVSTNLPADNFYPADLTAVGFQDLGLFPNVVLAPSSTFAHAALDGKDVGVDYALSGTTAVLSVYNDRQAGVVTSGSLVDASSPWTSGQPGIFALGDNVLITAWRAGEAPLLERARAIVSLLAVPIVAADSIAARLTEAPASLDIKTFVNVAAADSLRGGLAEAGLVTIASAPVNVSVFAADSLPVELEPSRLASESLGVQLTEASSIVSTAFFVAASAETIAPHLTEAGVRLTVSNSTPQTTDAPTPVVVDQVRELSVADFATPGEIIDVGNLVEDSDAFPFVPGPTPGLDTIRVVWPERSAIFVQPLVVESVRAGLVESGVQAVSIASSDSFVVAMTDTGVLTIIAALIVAADSVGASTVDDPLLQIGFFSADSVATSTSEATRSLQRTLLAPTDTLGAGLTEGGRFPVQALQPATDSLATGLTETASVVILGQGSFFASADAQSLNATEMGFVLASVLAVASDSLAVQASDTSAFLAATSIAASDSLAVGETETGALLVNALVTAADSVSASTSEATALTILETGQFRAVTDSEMVGLSEAGRPLVIVASSEVLAVALTEVQVAAIAEPSAELMPLTANDLAALIERAMNNAEPAGVRVTENGEVLIVGGLVELTAVDVIAGTITDSQDPELNEIDRGDGVKFRVGGRMPAGELVASPSSSRVRTWWEWPYAR